MTTAMTERAVPELAPYLRKILEAMETLPAGAVQRQISDKVRLNITTHDMNQLVERGVVERVARTEPPFTGYRLIPGWRHRLGIEFDGWLGKKFPEAKVRAAVEGTPAGKRVDHMELAVTLRIGPDSAKKLLDHYGLWEPNPASATQVPATVPTPKPELPEESLEQLAARVTREQLQTAMGTRAKGEGLSLGAIAARFETTPKMIRDLIERHDLWCSDEPKEEETTPMDEQAVAAHPAPQVESEPASEASPDPEPEEQSDGTKRPRMTTATKAALVALFCAGEGVDRDRRRAIADQFGVSLKAVDIHYYRWRNETQVADQQCTEDLKAPGSGPHDSCLICGENAESAARTDGAAGQVGVCHTCHSGAMADRETVMRSKAELAQAKAELEELRLQVQELTAVRYGRCYTCIHHVDGFCKYMHMAPQAQQIPDEKLLTGHQGKRIVFGRPGIESCDLYHQTARPEQAG